MTETIVEDNGDSVLVRNERGHLACIKKESAIKRGIITSEGKTPVKDPLDINDDHVVDKKDAKLARKVIRAVRKLKK